MDVQYRDAGNHTLFIYLPAFLDTAWPAQRECAQAGLDQVPCEAPSLPNPTTHKGWPHHRGVRPLLFSNYSDVGYFMSHMNKSV